MRRRRCTAGTPVGAQLHRNWKGVPRPWHAAILWDRDYRFSVPLLEALRAEDGIAVGENDPTTASSPATACGSTARGAVWRIPSSRYARISFASAEGQRAWSERIAAAVEAVFARNDIREAMRRVQYFSLHTDTEATPPFTSPAERNPA